MKVTSRGARRYLCAVRSLLPPGRTKRILMAQIKSRVLDCLAQQPEASEEELREQLGEPQDIAAAYVENMGTAAILKGLRVHRWIITAIAVTVLVIFLSWVATAQWIVNRASNASEPPYIITSEE